MHILPSVVCPFVLDALNNHMVSYGPDTLKINNNLLSLIPGFIMLFFYTIPHGLPSYFFTEYTTTITCVLIMAMTSATATNLTNRDLLETINSEGSFLFQKIFPFTYQIVNYVCTCS
jgi:hypothetical protein